MADFGGLTVVDAMVSVATVLNRYRAAKVLTNEQFVDIAQEIGDELKQIKTQHELQAMLQPQEKVHEL